MSEPTIVIATRNRGEQLRPALRSISAKNYAGVDMVIVDDASTDDTPKILQESLDWLLAGTRLGTPTLTSEGKKFYTSGIVCNAGGKFAALRIFRLNRSGGYRRNPSVVLNFGHRQIQGDIIIEQGGEVCHLTDCVRPLTQACKPGLVALARVHHGSLGQMALVQAEIDSGSYFYPDDFEPDKYRTNGSTWPAIKVAPNHIPLYCGKERPAPFIFLGGIHRDDLKAVGGYDEGRASRNDEDLANRLLARGVRFRFIGNAVAFHLQHGKT